MGWDYWQCLNQPMWFLNILADQLEIDSKKTEKELSKIKKK